jgi:chloramphenicol 3-O phosphotransferase
MVKKVQVVLLNGVGSSGKTSIAKALQTMTAEPFLHVQMDAFFEMLPESYQQHPEGFTFETVCEDGKPAVVIKAGPVGERAMDGMRHAIAAMAAEENNLIVDDVLTDGQLPEYRRLLAAFHLRVVGVFAPLDVLEARERGRGDRLIGLARRQFDRVHAGVDYDLQVDTSITSALECARLTKARFGL